MQDEADEERNVIPRWRPLRGIEKADLASIKPASPEGFERNLARLNDEVRLWQNDSGIVAAADLFDAYLITGDRRQLRQAISALKSDRQNIPDRLRSAFSSAFRTDESPLDWRAKIAANETDENFVRQSIRLFKRQILEYPRDGLLHVEIARLYTVIGSYHKAEYHLNIAIILYPNNRYILRSMMQFYDTVGDLYQGLKNVRKSGLLKFDPWIQSAEVAAATNLGKSSVVASHKLIRLDSNGNVARHSSELAMAMATLDRLHGVKERKVFQLVRNALPHATENGFAQAVWLSNRSTREFAARFPEAHPSEDAYEARVKISMKERDFPAAAKNAEMWLKDQPFSVDALITYLNLRSIHVGPDEASLLYAKRAIHVHGDNWHVMNACVLVFAEAGDFESSRLALARMERQANSEGISAFLAAARGFLAFAEGNFVAGRGFYEEAIRLGRVAKSNYLIVDALIFWFRAEALSGLLTNEFIEQTSEIIDRSLLRIQQTEKSFLNDVWFSVKQRIASRSNIDREKNYDAIAANVAAYIEDPLLL